MVFEKKYKVIEINNVFPLLLLMTFFFFPKMASYFRVVTFYPVYFLWFLTSWAMYPKIIQKGKRTCLFLIYVFLFAILFVAFQSDNTPIKKFITTVFISYNWGFALYFYSFRKDLFKCCIYPMLFMFIIGTISTYKGLHDYPMASRILATGTGAYDENMVQMFKRIGIGGYDFIYSIVFLLPTLLCLIRYEKKFSHKIAVSVTVLLSLICVLQSGYSTAILFSLLGISTTLIILVSKSANPYPSLAILTGCIIVAWSAKSYLFDFIGQIGDSVGAYYVSIRMSQLSSALSDNGVESLERVQLYGNAVKKFLASPLLGNLTRTTDLQINSGHSEVLNYLEMYGITGISYILFLLGSFKDSWKLIKHAKLRVVLIINQMLFFLFAIINRVDSANGTCMIALFIAPMIVMIIESDRKTERENI